MRGILARVLERLRQRSLGIRSGAARSAAMFVLILGSAFLLSSWFEAAILSAPAAIVRTAHPGVSSAVGSTSDSKQDTGDLIPAVCGMIYKGAFEAAGSAMDHVQAPLPPALHQLRQIVDQYEQVVQDREANRVAGYAEKMEELDKLRKGGVLPETDDPNAPRDPNDPNRIGDTLAVVAEVADFANETQKRQLLEDPFVRDVFQKAVDRAAALEAEGKWFEAYAATYFWLRTIDPNHAGYKAYAEELIEKGEIGSSLQDSPCETRKERYEGVDKSMFARALDVLHLQYVDSLHYPEMAKKGIKRSKLLAEVALISLTSEDAAENADDDFVLPSRAQMTAWSAALDALIQDIDESVERFNKMDLIEVLDKVLGLNAATVELPREVLIAHFVEAALSALDPHTVMVWPRHVQDFEKIMTNEFTGIGIVIGRPEGLLTVASLLPDTPAYRAGLDAGDVIEEVDGVPTKDMSLTCAIRKITGAKGSKVALVVKRQGEDTRRTITITRDRIIVPTISGWQRTEGGNWSYFVDEKEHIGYARITSFSAETAGHLDKVLNDLEQAGMRALILDLRFNTGGLLDSAVTVSDLFIEKGLITRTQPRGNMIPSYEYAHKKGTHPNYPVVVLINSVSASASEIVAGVLGDDAHDRAVLVGSRTHGKGSVQGITLYPGGGAQLKYTMAYYHLPSGQRVMTREAAEKQGGKEWGVKPDVWMKMRRHELVEIVDVQRDNDILVQADRGSGQTSPTRRSIEETLDSDPQLTVALLVAQAKLIEAQNTVASLN